MHLLLAGTLVFGLLGGPPSVDPGQGSQGTIVSPDLTSPEANAPSPAAGFAPAPRPSLVLELLPRGTGWETPSPLPAIGTQNPCCIKCCQPPPQ